MNNWPYFFASLIAHVSYVGMLTGRDRGAVFEGQGVRPDPEGQIRSKRPVAHTVQTRITLKF